MCETLKYTVDATQFTEQEITLLEVWALTVDPEPGQHTIGKRNPLVVLINNDYHTTKVTQ